MWISIATAVATITGIALVTAGIMSLAFMGFSGMARP
jgi:Na+-translocating ferredoxin:NAD+ oxidoreductase RnfA subunit